MEYFIETNNCQGTAPKGPQPQHTPMIKIYFTHFPFLFPFIVPFKVRLETFPKKYFGRNNLCNLKPNYKDPSKKLKSFFPLLSQRDGKTRFLAPTGAQEVTMCVRPSVTFKLV